MDIKVTDVKLTDVVGERHGGYDEEGEPFSGGPIMLRDLVVEEIARQMIDRHQSEWQIAQRIIELRDQMIAERLAPILDEVMARPIQPTDRFGHPTGEPTTMHALVAEAGREWLATKVDSQGRPDNGYGAKSRAELLMAKAVGTHVEGQLRALLDEEGKRMKASLQAAAAAHLAKKLG